MRFIRRIARPLLATVFVPTGWDQLRNPAPTAPTDAQGEPTVSRLPYVGEVEAETLVRVTGGVQLLAGGLLACGRLPRVSALALATTVVPTTLGAHRFWELDDPAQRRQHQQHFLKNLSILGGLVLAAVDTEGRPGLGWRARHTAEHTKAAARRTRRQAGRAARAADRTRQAKTAKAAKAVARKRPG